MLTLIVLHLQIGQDQCQFPKSAKNGSKMKILVAKEIKYNIRRILLDTGNR